MDKQEESGFDERPIFSSKFEVFPGFALCRLIAQIAHISR